MENFDFTLTEYEGNPKVVMVGMLSSDTLSRFKLEIEKLVDGKCEKIYLDMSKLRSVDSSSLGLIIFNFSYLKNINRHLILLNPSEDMSELLELSCLNKLIPIEIIN